MTVDAKHHAGTGPRVVSVRSPYSSWLSLLLAASFLLVANGRHPIAAATWLSMLFLICFVRMQPKKVGLPLAWLVLSATWAFQFRGQAPVPALLFAVLSATYGLILFLPVCVDRIVAPRIGGFKGTLVLPCTWVTVEWLVASFTPYGSWGSLAYTQYENLALMQIVAVTGIYGLSFLITWFASTGSWIWGQGLTEPGVRRGAMIFATVLALVLLGGGARLALFAPDAPTVRIASLSGSDIDLFEGVEADAAQIRGGQVSEKDLNTIRANARAITDDLLRRSDQEALAGAKIIFWGETDGFSLKENEPALIARGADSARLRGIYLGMSLAVYDPASDRPLENKIVLINPEGEVSYEYNKAIPVPGPEAAMQARGDGLIKTADSPFGRLGAVICFDMDFPGYLKQAGSQNVDIMLVPSNDWREIDPWHSHMARFRAVEQGFNMVRHATGGLSVATDYQGRILASMDYFLTDQRDMVALVPTRGVRTVYSRVGDLFTWMCILGLVALAGVSVRRSRA
jgi:apolipoprotein N-acyltransferase